MKTRIKLGALAIKWIYVIMKWIYFNGIMKQSEISEIVWFHLLYFVFIYVYFYIYFAEKLYILNVHDIFLFTYIFMILKQSISMPMKCKIKCFLKISQWLFTTKKEYIKKFVFWTILADYIIYISSIYFPGIELLYITFFVFPSSQISH